MFSPSIPRSNFFTHLRPSFPPSFRESQFTSQNIHTPTPIFTVAFPTNKVIAASRRMSATSMRRNGREARPTATNVYDNPLKLHSRKPMTGYFRDGFCDTDITDTNNHTVAGVMTPEFLSFSARRGNDLRGIPGMKQGTGWCLCANRWKEAYDAYKRGEVTRDTVPPVDLAATHGRALQTVGIDDLKDFAVMDSEGSTKHETDQYKGRRRRIGTMTGTVQT